MQRLEVVPEGFGGWLNAVFGKPLDILLIVRLADADQQDEQESWETSHNNGVHSHASFAKKRSQSKCRIRGAEAARTFDVDADTPKVLATSATTIDSRTVLQPISKEIQAPI